MTREDDEGPFVQSSEMRPSRLSMKERTVAACITWGKAQPTQIGRRVHGKLMDDASALVRIINASATIIRSIGGDRKPKERAMSLVCLHRLYVVISPTKLKSIQGQKTKALIIACIRSWKKFRRADTLALRSGQAWLTVVCQLRNGLLITDTNQNSFI